MVRPNFSRRSRTYCRKSSAAVWSFDPPYRPINPTSFTSYSKESFNDREQIRLRDFFRKMDARGCHLMLSNSDGSAIDPTNTYLDDLYQGFFIDRVFARRSISRAADRRGPIPELLIRNYGGRSS